MATIIGTTGNDNGVDHLGGQDQMNGQGGNDIIFAGPSGSDTVDGGSGNNDSLVLNGNFADYTVSYDSANHQLVLTKGAVTETISGVESIAFDDQVVQVAGA